ncbi:MarR family winged helix-turn-helix transcriptional regulator [Arenibaculum pallidiluteum]|uniref:MarR family winged helix-turn-helix transcriptional regulator n=1 Tax=Arenibaculum pallidiluteum TaxID=2812559 RepID=UPI001A95ACF2|nr:MarR family transcriptional regulator [Arenibaculum pallidiluteum]
MVPKDATQSAGDAEPDHVDELRAQWAREMPGLDTEPMALLGRAYRITRLARPVIEANFARFGIDGGEFDVLAALRRSGPPFTLTPTRLYDLLMISSGGLTHRLRRLEEAGLVAREPSAEDRRSLAVRLTAQGRQIVEAAFRADMEVEAGLLDGLAPEDRRALEVLLRKLHKIVRQRSRAD